MNQTIQPAVSVEVPPAAPPTGTDLRRGQRRQAMLDLVQGLVQWPLWFTIGWMDVRQRYRRSLIGPFWITLSLGIFVGGLGVVYGALFRVELQTYLPYLATGMITWTLISTLACVELASDCRSHVSVPCDCEHSP